MAKPTETYESADDESVNLRAALKFVAWGAVAASAAAVVVLVAQTEHGAERLAGILSGPTRASAEARPVEKVNPLAARLAETESEAQRLGDTVRRLTADRDKVVARLDALEHNLDVTGSIPARDAAPTSVASQPVAANPPAAAPPSPPVATNPSPAPAPQQTASLAPTPAAAEQPTQRPGAIISLPTALLAPPASATPAAAAPPEPANPPMVTGPAADSVATKTDFGVDLGGDRTVDALRALWNSMRSGRHAALFAGLRPLVSIRESGKSGAVEFRLVVGPLVNAGAAARLCGTLAAAGLACQPAVFDGQRLALR